MLSSLDRDKIEAVPGDGSWKNGYYYKLHGKKIVAKYRKRARQRFGETFFSAGNNFGSPLQTKRGTRVEELPTFWEFVQYVKAKPTGDGHWAPVFR